MPPPAEPVGGYSLASLMMFVTLVSVVLGLSTIAPGVGVPLGMILLVVWLRTAAVARQRRARGLAVTWEEKVQLFLTSFGVTVALGALLSAAGFAALLAACFACMASSEVISEDAAWFVFWGVMAAIMGGAFYVAGKWVYHRWQVDIGEAD